MSKIYLNFNDLTILPQPRKDFSGVPRLADDIREHGVLQPPTITPSRRLLYGECRVRACKLLGMDGTWFNVYEKDLKDDEILEIQVAENVARNELTWQERALSMLEIYRLKQHRGALEGWNWGQREASALFKIQLGTVNYILRVAAKLKAELSLPDEDRRYWKFDSAADAYRNGLLAEEEDRMLKELAKREQTNINSSNNLQVLPKGTETEVSGKLFVVCADGEVLEYKNIEPDEARAKYESNPLNTIPYDVYLREKQRDEDERANVIYLSNRIIHGDSIDYMLDDAHEAMFDHIITDIPYAIDVANMQQTTKGILGVERTEDAHEVDENEQLHSKFFEAAFKCTKDRSYVITFCDMMQFSRMVELAELAGFSAQRWPLIWPKTIAMNSSAHCNSTKNYEVALICHKPGGTFVNKLSTSFLPNASNVEAKKITGHVFAKPFEVTKVLCEAISHEGQRILEPFAGGGSMVLQMLKMKREVFAVEKAEHQYNALLENIKREHYLKLNPKFIFK